MRIIRGVAGTCSWTRERAGLFGPRLLLAASAFLASGAPRKPAEQARAASTARSSAGLLGVRSRLPVTRQFRALSPAPQSSKKAWKAKGPSRSKIFLTHRKPGALSEPGDLKDKKGWMLRCYLFSSLIFFFSLLPVRFDQPSGWAALLACGNPEPSLKAAPDHQEN